VLLKKKISQVTEEGAVCGFKKEEEKLREDKKGCGKDTLKPRTQKKKPGDETLDTGVGGQLEEREKLLKKGLARANTDAKYAAPSPSSQSGRIGP